MKSFVEVGDAEECRDQGAGGRLGRIAGEGRDDRRSRTLPDPPGRHFDFEMNQNIVDKDNWIYTENIFFTNKECIKQISDKSDNYLNIIGH